MSEHAQGRLLLIFSDQAMIAFHIALMAHMPIQILEHVYVSLIVQIIQVVVEEIYMEIQQLIHVNQNVLLQTLGLIIKQEIAKRHVQQLQLPPILKISI